MKSQKRSWLVCLEILLVLLGRVLMFLCTYGVQVWIGKQFLLIEVLLMHRGDEVVQCFVFLISPDKFLQTTVRRFETLHSILKIVGSERGGGRGKTRGRRVKMREESRIDT